jgi:hypothetical protein
MQRVLAVLRSSKNGMTREQETDASMSSARQTAATPFKHNSEHSEPQTLGCD